MGGTRPQRLAPALILAVAAVLAAPSPSYAAKRATVTVRTVEVGAAGNPAVGIVPFTDAIYQSCADAPPPGSGTPACQMVGGVDDPYEIGELEVTVADWVKFLNTVDPSGKNRHGLYTATESSAAWPKYGQINRSKKASDGRHYS